MDVGSPEKQKAYCTVEGQSPADREFVTDLIANKPGAWERFIDYSAKIIAYHKKHLQDFGFSIHDLTNTVFIYLTENDNQRLRKFLINNWPLFTFVRYAFRAAKSRLLYNPEKNRENEVSDSDLYIPLIDQNHESGDGQNSLQDYREVLKLAFSTLWESNSQRAYVYFLRRKLELPSREIAELLDITVNNVDVVLKRAESELKNILEEMGIKNDILHDN
jgi:RNA polymerase sigma factor (sigma-70 family)